MKQAAYTARPDLRIEVDDRESPSGVIEALGEISGVTVVVKRFGMGDYATDGDLLFERKTLPDFAVSVIDGRLFKQAIRMARGKRRPVLVIEGTAREDEGFGLSVISVSEMLHGVHRADSTRRRLKRSAFVEKVIEQFPIYPFDVTAARVYAEIWADLAVRGIPIGAHDLIIGATALSLNFSVATCNLSHFSWIEGLVVEHWHP